MQLIPSYFTFSLPLNFVFNKALRSITSTLSQNGSIVASLLTATLLVGCNANLPLKTTDTASHADSHLSDELSTTSQNNTSSNTNENAKDDVWQRIRQGYQLSTEGISHQGQKRMDAYINRYQKHPEDILRQTQQASLYLHYIISELEKNNIPSELALLPFVESRFDPFAYSSGRASGLWQFIPITGQRFKLANNWWMDERRDIIASTQAAIDYFTYLHKHFKGDWLLAIAAYNAGEGTVGRAIKRNQQKGLATDYWSLPLPQETRNYLPKLFAWASIIQQPQVHNLSLADAPNTPTFTQIDIGSQIDLAKLSTISDIPINTIYALNPAFNRWASDPQAPHELLIPIDKKETVEQALLSHPIKDRIQWQRYTVQQNDSLSVIAEKHNTSVTAIKSANGLRTSTIRIGQKVLIPTASKNNEYYSDSVDQRLLKRQNTTLGRNKQRIQHTVKPGETLWSIAKRYQVSTKQLAFWNNMSPRDILRKKQKIILWRSL